MAIELTANSDDFTIETAPRYFEMLALTEVRRQSADWANSTVNISVSSIVRYAKSPGYLVGLII